MKIKWVLVSVVFITSRAAADPIHLRCEHDTERVAPFEVTLDENTTKITHTEHDGSAFNTEGFFSASTVTYQKIRSGTPTVVSKYEIDRTNLSFTATVAIELINSVSTYTGTCEVVVVQGRRI